jgi:hypothetical protein
MQSFGWQYESMANVGSKKANVYWKPGG